MWSPETNPLVSYLPKNYDKPHTDLRYNTRSTDPNILTIAVFARLTEVSVEIGGFELVLVPTTALLSFPSLRSKYGFEYASRAEQDEYRSLFGPGCEMMLFVHDVNHYHEVDVFADWINGVAMKRRWSDVDPSFITAWVFGEGIEACAFQNVIVGCFVAYFEDGRSLRLRIW